jgi:hypothetical protein
MTKFIVTRDTKYYNSVNYFESKEIAEVFALEMLEEYKEWGHPESFSICVAEVLQTLSFIPEEE